MHRLSQWKTGIKMLVLVLFICFKAQAQRVETPAGKLLFAENFTSNTDRWLAETEPLGKSSVYTKDGQLIMDTAGGVTVWFDQRLEGNIRIEYDWKVLVGAGANDRLSDLNQFWMASDPKNKNLFTRAGKFETYDSLALYYAGMGGNTNTTTRFRRYQGNGSKPLLQEYSDPSHLLKPNHSYHIIIKVDQGQISFSADGELLFDWADPDPLTSGYFGFRSTAARHVIRQFRVYRLP